MIWLVLSLVAILIIIPFIGWAVAAYLMYKTYTSEQLRPIEKKFAYVGLIIASLLPIHSILVYPLIVQECNLKGGEKTFQNMQVIPKDIVIDGDFYNIRESFPVTDLLLTETANSIYYLPGSNFGEGTNIKSAAENYRSTPFMLKLTDPYEVGCGPFFQYTTNKDIEYRANNPTKKCISYSQEEPANTYLRMRKTTENERSIKTAWHTIEWNKVTYDIISKNSTLKIYETRNFHYKGLTYPLFLNYSSAGSYSCKANPDPHLILNRILHKTEEQRPVQKISKQDSKSQIKFLQNSYFGFELPVEVQKYDVSIFDHNNISSPNNPLKINIIAPKSELPILLELSTNKFIDWNIKSTDNRNIIVNLNASTQKNRVFGLDPAHIIEITTESYGKNPLHKYYTGYFTILHFESTKNNRYCSINERANGIEMDIDLSLCTNKMNNSGRRAIESELNSENWGQRTIETPKQDSIQLHFESE